MTTKAKWVATCGVSWRTADGTGWVNREAGEDVSDAPESALRDFRGWPEGAPAAVTEAEWKKRSASAEEPVLSAEGEAGEVEAGDGKA